MSRVWYDWPTKRMASNHTQCISGNYAVSHAPCAIVMHNNVTSCISDEVEGGCCIYPDTIGKSGGSAALAACIQSRTLVS